MLGTVVILVFYVSAAALAYAYLVRRFMRHIGEGDPEWRRRWRALERPRRKEIIRTLRRGEPVTDPAHAELALGMVNQADNVRRAARTFDLLSVPANLGLVAVGAATGRSLVTVVGAVTLVVLGAAEALSVVRRRRLHAAADATRRFLDGRAS